MENIVQVLNDQTISSEHAVKAMDRRQAAMVFPYAKMIEAGGEDIDSSVEIIKNAILDSNGIIESKNKKEFDFFVKNCMSQKFLDLKIVESDSSK